MLPKEECEVLMNELVEMASTFLKKSGEFFPFGCVMKNVGLIEHIAFYDGNEHPESKHVIKKLTDSFHQFALDGEIKASGIVWDAKVLCPDNQMSDAVVTSLEHRDNYSVNVVFPYKKTFFRTLKWKPLFASEGDKNIFV